MKFNLLAAVSLASLAVAQNTTVIQVGSVATAQGGVFQFIPNSVTAKNGTVITFRFSGVPGNHSVTQSSFSSPCQPLAGGFDSGWVLELTAPQTDPEFNLTVTDDSKPIWFFCKQLAPSPHCSAGMVGAINAPTSGSNTLSAFEANAKAFQGASGQSVGGLVGVGASASAAPGPITGPVSAFGVPTGASSPSGSGSGSGASPSTSAKAGNALSASADWVLSIFAAGLGLLVL